MTLVHHLTGHYSAHAGASAATFELLVADLPFPDPSQVRSDQGWETSGAQLREELAALLHSPG